MSSPVHIPAVDFAALDRGEVPDSLRAALYARGVALSPMATAKLVKPGRKWSITDPAWSEGLELERPRSRRWLHWFKTGRSRGRGGGARRKLQMAELRAEDEGKLSGQLVTALQGKGLPIPDHYTIRDEQKGSEWIMVNWGTHPEPARLEQPSVHRIKLIGDELEISDVRHERAYRATLLPTLQPAVVAPKERGELLIALYTEVCSSWRQLTDVRFKLLGLVPTVSVALLITLLDRSEPGTGLSPAAQTFIVVFGLMVTVAIYIYEVRNSELYDDLISRGRKIEEELGVDTGQFRGRRKPSKRLLGIGPVQHDVAIALIYWASILAWFVALVYIWWLRYAA